MLHSLSAAGLLFLVIFTPGPAWEAGKPTEQQPLREHGQYMLDLYDQDRMAEAGPFVGADGGAALLVAESESAARELLDHDPAVQRGVMVYTLRQWSPQNWKGHSERRKVGALRRAQAEAEAPAPSDGMDAASDGLR